MKVISCNKYSLLIVMLIVILNNLKKKNDIIGASKVLMEIHMNDFEPVIYVELESDVHARLT